MVHCEFNRLEDREWEGIYVPDAASTPSVQVALGGYREMIGVKLTRLRTWEVQISITIMYPWSVLEDIRLWSGKGRDRCGEQKLRYRQVQTGQLQSVAVEIDAPGFD